MESKDAVLPGQLDLEAVIARLMEVEAKVEADDKAEVKATAYAAVRKSEGVQNAGNRAEVICWICGGKGHISRDCSERKKKHVNAHYALAL